MTNIAIFVSGSGSNLENIVKHIQAGQLSGISITALYTDNEGVPCVDRAKNLNIPIHINKPKDFSSKFLYEQRLFRSLSSGEAQWIVLAGCMRLVDQDLLQAYEERILNIHPLLLPKLKGLDAIGQALESGDTVTGSTVHYVDSGMDTGEIIEQQQCDIKSDDTKERLEDRVKHLKHEPYPRVIAKIIK